MKVISTGYNIYNIIPGTSLESYDKIPANVYRIGFDPMKGFNLIKQDDFKVEEKIYGEHEKNIHIIIEGFKHSNRSMGVIFSGDKGLGKSLVARKLCVNMIKDEIIPVIIIDKYIDGIVEFIESIDQNVVLFFDEFDKMFSNRSCNDDDDDWGHTSRRTTSEQDRLLSLFDGTSSGKKLFILTCNNIYDISKYLINRTGRVHYHVRFEYPTDTEVKQYLEDNLINKDDALITKVSSFALITNLTFDSLRSICFELNLGRDFDDIIDILNIINYDSDWFKVDCLLSGGRRYLFDQVIDLFDYKNGGKCILDLTPEASYHRSPVGELIINLKDLVFQKSSRSWILKNPQKAKVVMYSRDEDNLICESLTIKRTEKNTYKFNF